MATPSIVSLKLSDDNYESIYIHYDGYPQQLGKYLYTNFKNKAKLQNVLKEGNLRNLSSKKFSDKLEFEPSNYLLSSTFRDALKKESDKFKGEPKHLVLLNLLLSGEKDKIKEAFKSDQMIYFKSKLSSELQKKIFEKRFDNKSVKEKTESTKTSIGFIGVVDLAKKTGSVFIYVAVPDGDKIEWFYKEVKKGISGSNKVYSLKEILKKDDAKELKLEDFGNQTFIDYFRKA